MGSSNHFDGKKLRYGRQGWPRDDRRLEPRDSGEILIAADAPLERDGE